MLPKIFAAGASLAGLLAAGGGLVVLQVPGQRALVVPLAQLILALCFRCYGAAGSTPATLRLQRIEKLLVFYYGVLMKPVLVLLSEAVAISKQLAWR